VKQKDIALILVIIFISGVVSLFASKAIFNSPKNSQQQVAVVQPISSSFQQPDTHYFNNQAIDPTQLITIGQSPNADPFSASGGSQ